MKSEYIDRVASARNLNVHAPNPSTYQVAWRVCAMTAREEEGTDALQAWLAVTFTNNRGSCLPLKLRKTSYPDPWQDPKGSIPNSGLSASHGVDYRTLRWIDFSDPHRGLQIRRRPRF